MNFDKNTAANKVLPQWGVKCFYETFVLKQTVVHLLNFGAENPPLRQYPNRWGIFEMKHSYIIILLSISLTGQVNGQNSSTWTDFDTLEVYENSVLVDFVTYSDSNITEEGQAFLYPDSLELRKSKWLPRLFTTTVPADSMVLHGIVKSRWQNGKYRIGKYDKGDKLEMTYFDSNGNEITRQEFYGGWRSEWDPEQGTNRYFIHGTKKKKK